MLATITIVVVLLAALLVRRDSTQCFSGAARDEHQGAAGNDLSAAGPAFPCERDPRKTAALLQSWIEENDDQEQRETGEYLVQTLDEDRLSERRLFPLEFKGKTW